MKKKKVDEKTQDNIVLKQKQLEDQLRRTLADYQNLERRIEEEKKILSDLYSAIIIEKFLPILDNLESAQKHLNDQGLAIVISQFKDILEKENVEEIKSEGESFDPKQHEAIETVEDSTEGKVARVIAKGYKINDRVIRPARVAVTKAKETGVESSENQNQEANKISN